MTNAEDSRHRLLMSLSIDTNIERMQMKEKWVHLTTSDLKQVLA